MVVVQYREDAIAESMVRLPGAYVYGEDELYQVEDEIVNEEDEDVWYGAREQGSRAVVPGVD